MHSFCVSSALDHLAASCAAADGLLGLDGLHLLTLDRVSTPMLSIHAGCCA